ncbi:hypothetical protein [Nocardioides daejeonensis]|uniref:hypothetical protein n=1 Tax=Nocardioides daejeonensis TaxID=1046556 RepID=UPI000D74AEDA|nr:hypothetical protein [Nocardioides daejeonensis]
MRAPYLCLMALLPLAACGATAGSPERSAPPTEAPTGSAGSSAEIVLDFDHVTAEFGSVLPDVRNAGSARVRTEVTTANGGRVRLAPGAGDGGALRLPAYGGSPEAPSAALLVWDTADALSPGERDFSFGATFQLDEVSEGDPSDNGDNLMQRGLFADTAQLKLQLDHGVPSCRVAGSDGAVVVAWPGPIERGRWLAVRCTRVGGLLTLAVTDPVSGSPEGEERQERGDIGTVEFASDVPFAIGAKVLAGGALPTSATDQFNGVIDDVFVAVPG